MPSFRPDIREDFSQAEWNALGKHIGEPTQIADLKKNEVRCSCPKCGSPFVATLEKAPGPVEAGEITILDARLSIDRSGKAIPFTRAIDESLPGLTCTCGYTGPARRA